MAFETPSQTARSGDATIAGIRITHPDRVLFRDQGLTKLELARYYEAVAGRMLPFVENRLLSLVRCPQGRRKSCFYQKHAGDGFPDAIKRIDIEESSGRRASYLYVTDIAGIIAACQMGTLEFHIWWSTIDGLERPDRLVFDLDPDTSIGFGEVKRSAIEIRDRLADLGLHSFALVTGGKGIHVVVPLVALAGGNEAKDFAEAFARKMVADEPDRYTATMSKAKRKDRVFIDWLRNERGSTAIAPYSTRARAGGPVATPVSWDEVGSLTAANLFHPADVLKRLDDDDPWAAAAGLRQSITKNMRETVQA